MIVHILRMYSSKHPRTWDESLPYVQHSYNRALHSSTDHSPFQVGLGFQPLGPIDVALPITVTSTNSSPAPTKADKETHCSIHAVNNFQIMIANGGSMKCGGRCENVRLQIGDYHLKSICFLLTWAVVTLCWVQTG